MKIIAILESTVTAGGGYNQALNAIRQMARICAGRFEFEVLSTQLENVNIVQQFGIDCSVIKISLIDRVLVQLSLSSWWHSLQSRLEFVGPLEKTLVKRGADLAYFLTQSSTSAALQYLNYITTVFDLCHRDTPEFPEIRSFGRFQGLERHFNSNLSSCVLIITESELLTERVSQRYGIDRDRCLAMPMSPASFLETKHESDKSKILLKYQLDEEYFFYPAQFWAHKNHIRILEALVVLRESGFKPLMVFCGGNQGNLAFIEDYVERHMLREQVRFLGFVPGEDMRGLYEGSIALVMPTYFGPTNLPPLEAWMLGKPLIYSSHLKEQAGEAAIYVDPDDIHQLVEAFKICTEPQTVSRLVAAGTLRLQQIEQMRAKSEIELTRRLTQFEARRKCWVKYDH